LKEINILNESNKEKDKYIEKLKAIIESKGLKCENDKNDIQSSTQKEESTNLKQEVLSLRGETHKLQQCNEKLKKDI
jgi:hypothetical protein